MHFKNAFVYPFAALLSTPAASLFGAVAVTTQDLNIALNQPTSGDVAFSAPTARGVDGVIGGGNWTHADYPASATPYPGEGTNAPNPYWQVDLAGTGGSFDEIVIYDRLDGCCSPNRLNGSTITVLDGSGTVIGSPISVTGFPDNNNGSVLPSLTFNNGGAGWAGASAIRVDGTARYFQFSELQANILGGATVPVNWALGAAATMFDNNGAPTATWPTLPSSNLTDGNRSTVSHANNPLPHDNYYFEVDLGQEILVDNLDIYGRDTLAFRLEDYQVQLLDSGLNETFLYTHSGQTDNTGTNIDVIGTVGGSGATAQYVRVINANGADYGAQVAEVEVFGVMIPEPSTGLLAALAGLMLARRRR